MNLNLNLNDIENNMLPQHSKKSFFTLQIFQQTCFCLVSEKEFAEMVQYYFLTPKRWLNNFLKADRCLGLVKCYSCFDFNWNFWKFNYFSHFVNFNLSLRNYILREQKIFYIYEIYDCFSESRYIKEGRKSHL